MDSASREGGAQHSSTEGDELAGSGATFARQLWTPCAVQVSAACAATRQLAASRMEAAAAAWAARKTVISVSAPTKMPHTPATTSNKSKTVRRRARRDMPLPYPGCAVPVNSRGGNLLAVAFV